MTRMTGQVAAATKKWDWGRDGDPDDPENPNYQPPHNPNQLCLPFEEEITIEDVKAWKKEFDEADIPPRTSSI